MKSIWTPGRVQWTHPGRSHEAVLWFLWAVAVAFLCLWLVAIAFSISLGGWIHILAGAAVLVGTYCTYSIFKYGQFLERPLFRRLHGARLRRFRQRH